MHIWHKWWDGSSWSEWVDEDIGASLISTSAPTVSSWAENRLDVFARGEDNHMWRKWWNGSSWSDWEDLGGSLTSAPGCVSWGLNRIDCFARGENMQLWYKSWF
jgi:hypothetical protein